MDQHITASTIKTLRIKNGLTQEELARKLNVSNKTISKWENKRGYPDIALLEPIAEAFNISVIELLSGKQITNTNVSANLLKSKFYVCPICGNIINSVGDAQISCHGINLFPEEIQDNDDDHQITLESVEDEYWFKINHPMNKKHYISFISGIYTDKIVTKKLYPESEAEISLKKSNLKKIVYYCNRNGLFETDVRKIRK